MSDLDKPAQPCTRRFEEKYMDEGGYGRNRQVQVAEGGLTKREYAAIHLRVPRSGNEELDSIIRESLRNDFAKAAMQGMLSNSDLLLAIDTVQIKGMTAVTDRRCHVALAYADAMLARMEEER